MPQRSIERILRKALTFLESGIGRSGPVFDCRAAEISVLLVSDKAMRGLNARYRGIDKTTDVLSFPQHDRSALHMMRKQFKGRNLLHDPSCITDNASLPLGDIVISIPQAKRQASAYGISLHRELARLLIHGLLHLLGYDHEENRYQAKKMRELEEALLKKIEDKRSK